MARKYDLPVVPLHITARNSALFYLFDRIHPTLRDITLFHEVLNKTHQRYRITLGPAIDPDDLPAGSAEAIEVLRRPHPGARRREAADGADRADLRPAERLRPARLMV